jgi:hypothetical protein
MLKYAEMRVNDGFDPNASPRQWLMVRHTSIKQLFLQGAPAGKKVVMKSGDDATARASFIAGVVTVRGLGVGTTQIWAEVDGVKDDDTVMDVNVKAMLVKTFSFIFVSDSAGHHTTRNPANLDGIIARANLIYLPQANVFFKKGAVKQWKSPADLGDPVLWSKSPDIFAQADSSADGTFFFVWEFENSVIEETEGGVTMTTAADLVDAQVDKVGGSNCLFEDSLPSPAGVILAHEAGHMLGIADRKDMKDQPFLMFGVSTRGTKIPKADADVMNSSGVPTPAVATPPSSPP